ncbi:MAG: cupin domain-containing protein [Acidimicrobiales bacterium]
MANSLINQTLRVVGDEITVVADGPVTGGGFELFVLDGPEGSGPPPHAHPWFESYVVLEGEVLVSVDGSERLLTEGDTAIVPAGAVHTFTIRSSRARFSVATSGDKASAFFADLSARVPGAPTPETLPGVIEVAKRHGLSSPLF